jgi:hypothetical protein
MESAERNQLFSTASYARILVSYDGSAVAARLLNRVLSRHCRANPAKHNTCEQSYQSNACETGSFHATALSNPNIARVALHFGKYDHLCEIAISDIHPRQVIIANKIAISVNPLRIWPMLRYPQPSGRRNRSPTQNTPVRRFGNGARMDQHGSIAHVSRHTEPRDFLLHFGYHG